MAETLEQIIQKTNKPPTIVNDSSKFVVVTYWWGRGNLNANTARPCISFYEDFIRKINNYFLNLFNSAIKATKNDEQLASIIKTGFTSYKSGKTTHSYNQIVTKIAKNYLGSVHEYCKLNSRLPPEKKDELALAFLEKLKADGKTPADYEYRNMDYVIDFLKRIIKYIVIINEEEIIRLFITNRQAKLLRTQFEKTPKENTAEYERIKNELMRLQTQKTGIDTRMKTNLKIKHARHDANSGFEDPVYNNTNIFDILNIELRYLSPLKFEEMIAQWEGVCQKNGCNFLSVEYPEFATPAGYQLAINAKPLFIKKALELCKPFNNKAVLYIDGDMYVRKYPSIFDMPDVDFMARGWWIDPRSSYKMDESIMYDPYTFETSGGTMYFSQSLEANKLLIEWIKESAKPYNKGKADDRILSLVFNTFKLLLPVKIIQLPIEYLWLSLNYDERLLEEPFYDYNLAKMTQSIFIEHPECLTSEETASGSGASSDRTPKFYNFLDEEQLMPTSEKMHEFIFFPNKEMTSAFEDYFRFMDEITYIDDGNEALIKRGYVNPEDPFESESPIYIVKYDDRFGNKPHSSGELNEENPPRKYSVNEIVDINMKWANSMTLDGLPLVNSTNDGINIVEINQELKKADGRPDDVKLIRLIIKLLQDNKMVIYNPTNSDGYDSTYYRALKAKMDVYKHLEFVFTPKIDSFVFSDFFKPKIQTNAPMLFCPGNDILIKFLSMFLSLDDLSGYLNYGGYEFMSRIRVGYVFKTKALVQAEAEDKSRQALQAQPKTQDIVESQEEAKTQPEDKSQPELENQVNIQGQGQGKENLPVQFKAESKSQFGGNPNGDSDILDKYIDDYETGLDMMYSSSGALTSGGKKHTRRHKKIYKTKFTRRLKM